MKTHDTSPLILIADDQPDVLAALRLLLKGEGFQVETVSSPAHALAVAAEKDFAVALIDLNYTRDTTSGAEGLDLLGRLQALDSTLPVVVMTAWSNVDLAVVAMRRGARDFIQKPWDNARLLTILRNQIELARAVRQTHRLEAENALLRGSGPDLIAQSPAMQPVLALIQRVGPADANVLILGENGTGKGVVARALHAVSPRANGPFVTVNLGGLSEGVFESELFGHVKGAFTDAKADRVGRFELAEGGTLFLDEIGNVPPPQQVRVLGHELNNSLAPVKSIAGSLESLLRREPLPADWHWRADARAGLQVIASRAEALNRYVGAYAQLARLPKPRLQPVELTPLIQRVAALEARVPVSVLAGPPCTVAADADQLEQALINLVRNGAEAVLAAGAAGGGVRLAWARTGGDVELTVEDDGTGLASTANLFVPFFTTKQTGSGIGLILCRQIVENHSGSLTLENRARARGCVARLRLPCARVGAAPTPVPS